MAIPNSGDAQFGLTADSGDGSYRITRWHQRKRKANSIGSGTADEDGDGTLADTEFVDLTGEYVSLDEDQSSGTIDRIAPWMRVTATIPSGTPVSQSNTSITRRATEEELFGGATKAGYGTDSQSGCGGCTGIRG